MKEGWHTFTPSSLQRKGIVMGMGQVHPERGRDAAEG